jgi:hypothetical protein
MKKYIYQKFLLRCDYETVELKDIPGFRGNLESISVLGEEYNLFDIGKPYTRKVSLTEMDISIDTVEDWKTFTDRVNGLDELVIYNDSLPSKNKVLAEYRLVTLKAYLYRLSNDCKKVKLYYNTV